MSKKQPSRTPFFQNPSMQLVLAATNTLNNGELRLLQSVIEGLLKPSKPKEREQLELDLQGGES
jgi:hypothetical protein